MRFAALVPDKVGICGMHGSLLVGMPEGVSEFQAYFHIRRETAIFAGRVKVLGTVGDCLGKLQRIAPADGIFGRVLQTLRS